MYIIGLLPDFLKRLSEKNMNTYYPVLLKMYEHTLLPTLYKISVLLYPYYTYVNHEVIGLLNLGSHGSLHGI